MLVDPRSSDQQMIKLTGIGDMKSSDWSHKADNQVEVDVANGEERLASKTCHFN